MKRDMRIQRAAMQAAAVIVLALLAGCNGCSRPKPLGYVPRQGKLEQPLVDYMVRVPANRPISIVVVMTNQVTEERKRALFQPITETNDFQRMEKQRAILTQELKQVAQVSQAPFLTYLGRLETNGVVRNVKSLWLANVIAVQAPSPVITSLALSNEVESLHLDLPQRVIRNTVEVPWGIKQIRATNLPVMAATTKPVLVAVLDTGVDYKHPDLTNHIWANKGWNFSGAGSNDPRDLDGHGTHVAGIIAGDGTGGTRTGIAPQVAEIMALRKTDAEDRTTEGECWSAIQYAIDNKARIMNFSSGWMDSQSPAYSTWRLNVQNATDHGLLFVTVSGNEGQSGSVPFRVDTPGRVPAALTVGASGQNSSDTVPRWSCQGPVTWQANVPFGDYPYEPGLTKPDLVAPGEHINSTKLGGGYVEMDGTSMAAPHVAGVAALVLAKTTNLNPYEVRYILEETAKDLYNSGPDTNSGWGRVDATSALAFPPIDPTPYDLAVGNLHVNATPVPGQPALFFASVTNIGGRVVGNAEMRFYFADAQSRSVTDLSYGNPSPTKFKYIGSYFVPVIGPKNSRHKKFEGVVRWTIPSSRQQHWWLGVWVRPGSTSRAEINLQNNGVVIQLDGPGGL